MSFRKIRFVTDSTCDIPADLITKWRIGVVPAFVNYDGRSFADDGIELDREVYYRQIPGMAVHPTTSAPPPALAERIIKDTFQDADHLIILSAPATLSGIFNTLRLGASSLPAHQVTQLDSGTVSMGLGWQVLAGAETAAETGDVQRTLDAIQRMRQHVKLYAAPETMEYLRRSGRVGWAAASVGALLQIKPIVTAVDGVVPAVARVRTFAKAIEKLVELARSEAPLERLVILHANNLDGVEIIREKLADVIPPLTYILNVNPAIGTHIGPGSLGVVTVSQSWRQ